MSKLYELQIDNGSLGHKLYDGVVCGSFKKVTFEDNESIGLAGRLLVQVPKLLSMTLTLNI